MTAGSSMQAMILTLPPQASQVSSGTSLCPPASRQSATVHQFAGSKLEQL